MAPWSLPEVLAGLHGDIERRLGLARAALGHTTTKGAASEHVWREVLRAWLPQRYRVESAHVVDSTGAFSRQLDIVILDRQYSPLLFAYAGQLLVPAESVYAVFETKQTINAKWIADAQRKMASVRRLARTSVPIPHAGGVYEAKAPAPILGGFLALESSYADPLGRRLRRQLSTAGDDRLDLGCLAAHGLFAWDATAGAFRSTPHRAPATAFLFELLARLQERATVPMLDVRAYAKALV